MTLLHIVSLRLKEGLCGFNIQMMNEITFKVHFRFFVNTSKECKTFYLKMSEHKNLSYAFD